MKKNILKMLLTITCATIVGVCAFNFYGAQEKIDLSAALLDALNNEKLEDAKKLLESGARLDVRYKGLKGREYFLLEEFSSHPDMLKILLSYATPEDINRSNIRGITPLLAAIRNQRVESTKLLIDAGADVVVKGENDQDIFNLLFSQIGLNAKKEASEAKKIEENNLLEILQIILNSKQGKTALLLNEQKKEKQGQLLCRVAFANRKKALLLLINAGAKCDNPFKFQRDLLEPLIKQVEEEKKRKEEVRKHYTGSPDVGNLIADYLGMPDEEEQKVEAEKKEQAAK